MNININDMVKVKLTECGIEELKRQHKELRDMFPMIKKNEFHVNIDSDGYSKFQLHVLMNSFGHMLSVGSELPFHPVIKYGDDQ